MAWFNPALEWWFPHDYKTHSLATSMLGVSSVLALLISAFPGLIINIIFHRNLDMQQLYFSLVKIS